MNQEKIGKFILELRKEKNMTQQELADALNVTDRAISKWENGRGMPDYSLIKPLCEQLGITVNDLLSGERLNKRDYQEKFEKNIMNTLGYSFKKIKKAKYVLVIFIGVVLLSLLTLFGIDVYRMKNNKPVFFSTWGFLYTPALNIEDDKIYWAVKNYLVREGDEVKHHDNEKTFVGMRVYLLQEKKDFYYVYSWILKEKYYLENEEIKQDSAVSIPCRFVVEKTRNSYEVVGYTSPKDGTYYEEDMKRIFPRSVLSDMDNVYSEGVVEKLQMEILEQVKLYYHK